MSKTEKKDASNNNDDDYNDYYNIKGENEDKRNLSNLGEEKRLKTTSPAFYEVFSKSEQFSQNPINPKLDQVDDRQYQDPRYYKYPNYIKGSPEENFGHHNYNDPTKFYKEKNLTENEMMEWQEFLEFKQYLKLKQKYESHSAYTPRNPILNSNPYNPQDQVQRYDAKSYHHPFRPNKFIPEPFYDKFGNFRHYYGEYGGDKRYDTMVPPPGYRYDQNPNYPSPNPNMQFSKLENFVTRNEQRNVRNLNLRASKTNPNSNFNLFKGFKTKVPKKIIDKNKDEKNEIVEKKNYIKQYDEVDNEKDSKC